MKKNLNIEILRSIALLFVVIYHIQCLLNKQIFGNKYVNMLINFGGEIGVTMFFIISGYCIYKSIDYKKDNAKFKYFEYLKGRFKRIAIPYYFCLLIGLTVTGSAIYLNTKGIFDILTHLTFTHNLFVSTHGSINGVLWTMGTFAQFYLIAPLLYKYIKKNPYLGLICMFVITVLSKTLIYNFLDLNHYSNAYYFVYGRQLLTALDNFALGMFLATCKTKETTSTKKDFVLMLIGSIAFIILIYIGNTHGLYNNNYLGYIWHSLLAVVLAIIFKSFMNFNINGKNIINHVLIVIGKYEYEIYLWHFILIANILGTGFIQYFANISTILVSCILLVISLVFGIIIKKNMRSI